MPFSADDLEQLKQEEIKETVQEWVAEQIEEDQMQRQLQLRHRLYGYAPFDQTLEELVRLKIRLHNGGSREVSHWNMAGISYELERIFAESPEWLKGESGAKDAEALENRIIDWAKELYQSRFEADHAGFDLALFSRLQPEQLVRAYIHGLMTLHLHEKLPQINWTPDEFLADLERIFEDRPQIGVNEIRSIQRKRIADLVLNWALERLGLLDADALRHRIVGYFSAPLFIDVLVDHTLSELGDPQAKELDAHQRHFLSELFGSEAVFAGSKENQTALAQAVSQQVQMRYRQHMQTVRDSYLQAMITDASTEEFLAAAIVAMIKEIAAGAGSDEAKQRLLSARMDFILQQRPTIPLPDSHDGAAIASFAEDIVAWSLKWYATYAERQERLHQETLSSEIVRDSVLMMIEDTVYAMISGLISGDNELDAPAIRRLESECRLVFRQSPRLSDDSAEAFDPNEIMNRVNQWARQLYQKRIEELGGERAMRYERYFVLEKIDENWRQHLNATDELREGIGLRGYGQKDPLLEYKREAYALFVKMIERINRELVSTLFKVFDVGGELEERQMRRVEPKNYSTTHSQVELFKQAAAPRQQGEAAGPHTAGPAPAKAGPVTKSVHVGRNDPCPCGSGKKYKNCCGRN